MRWCGVAVSFARLQFNDQKQACVPIVATLFEDLSGLPVTYTVSASSVVLRVTPAVQIAGFKVKQNSRQLLE
jgi:hypothetical protein